VVTAQTKVELQKSIPRAGDRIWNDYLNNITRAAVCGAANVANLWTGATMDALTDIHEKNANTATQKEEMLKCKSCPPNEHNWHIEQPPAGQAI